MPPVKSPKKLIEVALPLDDINREAARMEGFDESLQRIIKENCQVLKFSNAEFEDGE